MSTGYWAPGLTPSSQKFGHGDVDGREMWGFNSVRERTAGALTGTERSVHTSCSLEPPPAVQRSGDILETGNVSEGKVNG